MNIFLLLLIVLAAGVVGAFLFPRRSTYEVKQGDTHKQLSDGVEKKLLADDNKKLTGEHTRQWLDDFLKKQQTH